MGRILSSMPMSMPNNHLKTVLLLGALSALVVGVGAAFAPGHLAFFVLLALAMNVASYFFSDRLVLAMHRARPIAPGEAPRLHDLVEELAHQAGIPAPRLFLIDDPQPNAFATGRNPAHGVVAVTSGLLERLPARELRGVLAHELGHIRNRDILISTVAAALASLITYAAHALSFQAFLTSGGDPDEDEGGGLLMALLAPLVATLVQLGISRAREHQADATAAALTGDPEGLARALIRLESGVEAVPPATARPATASLFIINPLGAHASSVVRLFSTHPSTEERVARLRALASEHPTPSGAVSFWTA